MLKNFKENPKNKQTNKYQYTYFCYCFEYVRKIKKYVHFAFMNT